MRAFRTPGFQVISLQDAAAPEWIQIARVGTFFHPDYGKFTIDAKALAEMKTNFDKNVRGVDIALDYSHENFAEAAAWFKALELREEGKELWAQMTWTPKGKEVIESKEFRYISPEFTFNYEDNETLQKHGPVLLGAGLTNRPCIKNMEPVVNLSEYVTGADDAKDQKPQNEKPKKESKMSDKPAVKADLTPEQLKAMSQDDLVALVQECLAKLKEAEGQAQAAAAEKAMAEKKGQFAKLLTEGKVCKAQEEAFLANDVIKMAELAEKVKLETEGNGDDKNKNETDPAEEVKKLAEAMVKDGKAKTFQEAQSKVLSENPELKKKIFG